MQKKHSLGAFRLHDHYVNRDVLKLLSTSLNTYCACVTTWTYIHYPEDDAKLADFTSSSQIVNIIRACCDACGVRVQNGIVPNDIEGRL